MSAEAAEVAAQAAKAGTKKVKKIRHFKKPEVAKTGKPPKSASANLHVITPVKVKRDEYKIIIGPVVSDKASRKKEEENTVVLWVDIRATKAEIKKAVHTLWKVKPVRVGTLITSKFLKKAYVKLPEGEDANALISELE